MNTIEKPYKFKNVSIKELEVKNFKSFSNFNAKFKEGDINVIYGDNGVGKTTFIEVFYFLDLIFEKRIIEEQSLKRIQNFYGITYKKLYQDYSTVNCEDNIEIKLLFVIEKRTFEYYISFNKKNIVSKEYFKELSKADLNNVKKIFFEKEINVIANISNSLKGNISSENKIFFKENVTYSFFALFKSLVYNQEILPKKSNNFDDIDIILLFVHSFIVINKYNRKKNFGFEIDFKSMLLPYFIVNKNPIFWRNKDEENLKKQIIVFENQCKEFSSFVSEIDEKIIEVKPFLKSRSNNFGIQEDVYSLLFKRKINNKIVEIKYEDQSTGTMEYIKYFELINEIKNPKTSRILFFDELGLHLHESLSIKIMNYIYKLCKENNVQAFFTTHNTLLLNNKYTKLENSEKWILNSDIKGNAIMKNLKGVDTKENNQSKFLMGEYGGNDLNKII